MQHLRLPDMLGERDNLRLRLLYAHFLRTCLSHLQQTCGLYMSTTHSRASSFVSSNIFSLHIEFGVVLVFIAITLIESRCVLLCVGFVSCAACKHSVCMRWGGGFQIAGYTRVGAFSVFKISWWHIITHEWLHFDVSTLLLRFTRDRICRAWFWGSTLNYVSLSAL